MPKWTGRDVLLLALPKTCDEVDADEMRERYCDSNALS
jgi:hypothetical protein